MRLLLDSQLILWVAMFSNRLPEAARALMSDPHNELLFSAASIWEITIKSLQRRADFRVDHRLLTPATARQRLHRIARHQPARTDH